jgi:hypothetical protein
VGRVLEIDNRNYSIDLSDVKLGSGLLSEGLDLVDGPE